MLFICHTIHTLSDSEKRHFALTSPTNHIETDPPGFEKLIVQFTHSFPSKIYESDPNKFPPEYVKRSYFLLLKFRAHNSLTCLSCLVSIGPPQNSCGLPSVHTSHERSQAWNPQQVRFVQQQVCWSTFLSKHSWRPHWPRKGWMLVLTSNPCLYWVLFPLTSVGF